MIEFFKYVLENVHRDQIEILGLLVILFPLCFILSIIKNSEIKKIYLITTGGITVVYFYQEMALYIVLCPLVCWILMKTISEKLNCFLTFIIAFGTLSYIHYQRMFWGDNGGWSLDVNIPMMINTLKISSIPFLLLDGKKKDEELSKDQKLLKLTEKPTLLEYFGYILFLPTAIIGPYFEYKIYHNYIYSIEDFSDITDNKKCSRWPTVFNRLSKAFIYIIVYGFSQKFFDYKLLFQKRDMDLHLILSVLFAYTIKFRYIIGWMFSECHLAVCGVSYSKENNNYEGIKVIDDYYVIFQASPNTIFHVSF